MLVASLVRVSDGVGPGDSVPERIPLFPRGDVPQPGRTSGTPPPSRDFSVRVGRVARSSDDVVLNCESLPGLLSRRHAQFRARFEDPCSPLLQDLGGLNGTYVNGRRLEKGVEVVLKRNDVISFGGKESVARAGEQVKNAFVYRVEVRDEDVQWSAAPEEGEDRDSKRRRVDGDAAATTAAMPCCASYKLKETVLEQVEESFSCIICQDYLVGAACLAPCGHTFCAGCLMKWEKRTRTCPVCRQKFTDSVPMRSIDQFLESALVPLLEPEERRLYQKRAEEWKRAGKQCGVAKKAARKPTPPTVDLTSSEPEVPVPRPRPPRPPGDHQGFVYVPRFAARI